MAPAQNARKKGSLSAPRFFCFRGALLRFAAVGHEVGVDVFAVERAQPVARDALDAEARGFAELERADVVGRDFDFNALDHKLVVGEVRRGGGISAG